MVGCGGKASISNDTRCNMKYVRRPLPGRAQRALDEALDALMATQVCDDALDGSVQCGHERPCVFHRTYRPARNKSGPHLTHRGAGARTGTAP